MSRGFHRAYRRSRGAMTGGGTNRNSTVADRAAAAAAVAALVGSVWTCEDGRTWTCDNLDSANALEPGVASFVDHNGLTWTRT